MKICDFGLARDIYKDPDYVRKGDVRLFESGIVFQLDCIQHFTGQNNENDVINFLKVTTQVFWEGHQKNLIVKTPGRNLFSRLRNTCLTPQM